MATAVAFVLVVPYRLRGPAAVAGAVYATAVAASTLEAGWHRTSDALGAIFLVGGMALWACAVLVVWRGAGPRHPRPRHSAIDRTSIRFSSPPGSQVVMSRVDPAWDESRGEYREALADRSILTLVPVRGWAATN